jgi:4-amino-4-deoxy-L-arabinose transferase-like glycosyltransferase
MPVDETRYMSVAWEMFVRQGWFEPLTSNFEPYHHKPPLLFWLINIAWSIFGVSRWAGLIPCVFASLGCVYATSVLGKLLFPNAVNHSARIWLITAASLPFMIYGTLVMFDFTLCLCVLVSLIFIVKYAQSNRLLNMVIAGLCLGFGVLAKGPVAYLYVAPILILAPVWMDKMINVRSWIVACLIFLLISVLPIILWLIPVLQSSDNQFAYWLVWNQTAGRITGNFSAAHVHPFYFYIPLLPVLLMPWIFFPAFWRGIRSVLERSKHDSGVRFLLCWIVPVIVAFSLISGKQPHYLVPLVPGVALLIWSALENLSTRTLAKTFAAVLALFIFGQIIAAHTLFHLYNLQPIADIIRTQHDRDLAWVKNYHSEIGFLSRRETTLDDLQMDQIDGWFAQHPEGWAIIRYEFEAEVAHFHEIIKFPYRGKNIGIFSQQKLTDLKITPQNDL